MKKPLLFGVPTSIILACGGNTKTENDSTVSVLYDSRNNRFQVEFAPEKATFINHYFTR